MEIPSLSSRLLVTAMPSRWESASPDFVFAKCGVICSLWNEIAAKLRTKHAKFATFKKLCPLF